VDGEDLIDLQRREGQRHQRRDPVADLEVAVLEIVADVGDLADEHAAGAGDGVLLFAALGDDAHNHFADLLLVAAAGLADLGEGRGVDVQGDDVADDLIGVVFGHVVVDLLCRLRQHALGFDDAVRAVLVAFELFHGGVPPVLF